MLADLATLVAEALDHGAAEDIARAIESGALHTRSTAVVREEIASGRTGVASVAERLQRLWRRGYPAATSDTMAAIIRACAAGMEREREQSPRTQVVWTGPKVEGSYVRATREVVRELLREAQREILIVGYWLAATDSDGIIGELVQHLASAVQRGVAVTLLLDEGRRDGGGTTNVATLRALWPGGVAMPKLLTWKLPQGDKHVKLHAKVIVVDERDALVTSANLTMHALERNIEMGIRVRGQPARAVARHFKRLELGGEIS